METEEEFMLQNIKIVRGSDGQLYISAIDCAVHGNVNGHVHGDVDGDICGHVRGNIGGDVHGVTR